MKATSSGRRAPGVPAHPAPVLFRGLRRRFFRPPLLLLSAALALAAPGSLAAAEPAATGALTGRVSNADNGTYLTNARVEVEGTALSTFTNRFGEYRLEAVPAGAAKLDVFFTGMAPMVRTVAVTAGRTTRQDIQLSVKAATAGEESAVVLDTFVVASQRDTNQRSIAINEQRFSPTIKTVVATDQFGDITEGNIGEFVKFLPGITVGYTASDVRNISIRGVGSQYTAIMLDGYRVASADSGSLSYSSTGGGTRTTELEQISINNAARAEIVKARTPDLPADALGGSLNLVSKSAFEYKAPQFDYRVFGSMNSEASSLGATPGLRSDVTSHKVLPSFDFTLALPLNDRLGFTVSFLDSNLFNPQYRSNPQWSPNGTLSAASGTPADSPFLQKYTMQDGPKATHRKALEITADWKVSDRDVLSFRFQDNFYNSEFGNRNINFDTGSAAPLAYTPTSTDGALGKGSVSFGSSFRNKFGVTYNLGTEFVHTGSVWTLDAGINYSHAATHYADTRNGYFSAATYKIGGATVNYGGFDGVAPATIAVRDGTGADTLGNVFDVTNPNYVLSSIQSNPVDATDSFFTQQANLKRSFDLALPTTVKVGVQTQFERRDVDNYKITWSPVGDLALPGAAGAFGLADTVYNVAPPFISYSVVWPSSAKLYSLYEAHPELFAASSGNAQAAALGSLLFKERISAAYVMGDTTALDARLRLIYGVRFERTDDEGWGPLAVKSGSGTTYERRAAHAKADYTGTYPSLTVTYKLRDNLILRAAYTRAVGRPDIGNLVPNVSLPDSTLAGQTVSVSNPLLAPEEADNFDASIEYYFGQSVISAGVFRKDFTNFWGKDNVVGADALAILNSLGVADAQTYIDQGDKVSTTVNAGTAHITGVEFNYQQSLDGLAPFLQGTSVFANATAIQLEGATNADFSAFVSESVNWGVSYSNRRLSAKLNWNYRGRERDTPTVVSGADLVSTEYFAPRLYLDANLEIRLTKHVGLFFNGRNLTDAPQDDERYGHGTTPGYAKLYRREKFGTAFTFGVKGTF